MRKAAEGERPPTRLSLFGAVPRPRHARDILKWGFSCAGPHVDVRLRGSSSRGAPLPRFFPTCGAIDAPSVPPSGMFGEKRKLKKGGAGAGRGRASEEMAHAKPMGGDCGVQWGGCAAHTWPGTGPVAPALFTRSHRALVQTTPIGHTQTAPTPRRGHLS